MYGCMRHTSRIQFSAGINVVFFLFLLLSPDRSTLKGWSVKFSKDAMRHNVRVSSEVLPMESSAQEVCMKTHRRTRADMSLAAQRTTSTQLAESKKGSIKLAFTEKERCKRREECSPDPPTDRPTAGGSHVLRAYAAPPSADTSVPLIGTPSLHPQPSRAPNNLPWGSTSQMAPGYFDSRRHEPTRQCRERWSTSRTRSISDHG